MVSRDYRDKRGGHTRGRYACCAVAKHAEFTRECRRNGRHNAKQALRRGEEPEPMYPRERDYFD